MILQYQGDAIEVMQKLIKENVRVDFILTDPPYGTTKCKWDSILDLEEVFPYHQRLPSYLLHTVHLSF